VEIRFKKVRFQVREFSKVTDRLRSQMYDSSVIHYIYYILEAFHNSVTCSYHERFSRLQTSTITYAMSC
jgi:hypothetical protein